MGRLSEYINGPSGSRPAFLSGSAGGGQVEIIGAEQVSAMMASLLTNEPTMDRMVRRLIAQKTREARNRVSRDMAGYIKDDPRKAARAVKHMVYKTLFGSNISILSKRKASSTRATLKRERKLDSNPRQWGGNRRPRSQRTEQMDSYFGADRGFVLRFLSSGTTQRQTRFGNRGTIAESGMFGRIAPWHMEQAIQEVNEAILEYINKQANG